MAVARDGIVCDRGEQFKIYSLGSGTIIHKWIMGPPHLGYNWHSVVAGRHRSTVWDATWTSERSVYAAKVIAKEFEGVTGRIDDAFADCADPS